MPYYFGAGLTVILQIICGLHAYKNGRYSWLWIILFFPFVGCVIYCVAEVLPDLHSTSGHLVHKARRAMTPGGVLKELKDKVEFCDTYDNRLALADEYARCGQYQNALDLLIKFSAGGMHANDEHLLGKLAYSHFMLQHYPQAKEFLMKIRQVHGKFKDQELHLLLAVTLDKLKEEEACFRELEDLEKYYSGEEARCRYALMLKKKGEHARAKELFEKTIRKVNISPPFYKKEQQKWFEIAKQSVTQSA